MKLRTAIHGAAGRMGQRLVALGSQDTDLQIVAAMEQAGHPKFGSDAGVIAGVGDVGIPLSDQLPPETQVVIDFSIPAAAAGITSRCLSAHIPLVMATTGLNEETENQLKDASQQIPIVWAPSMSTTVNLAMKLTATAAAALRNQATGTDVEIIERHHRFKEDAPSGTALRFGEIVAEQMGIDHHIHGREGRPGVRPRNEIAYHAVRTGDNPGEHTIIFGLLGETLEITVKASHRDCYALGALAAAKFVARQPPGLYSMFDVLGI